MKYTLRAFGNPSGTTIQNGWRGGGFVFWEGGSFG